MSGNPQGQGQIPNPFKPNITGKSEILLYYFCSIFEFILKIMTPFPFSFVLIHFYNE